MFSVPVLLFNPNLTQPYTDTSISHIVDCHLPGSSQVEFNKAAVSLTETIMNPAQKKTALNRLLKVSVWRVLLSYTRVQQTPILKQGSIESFSLSFQQRLFLMSCLIVFACNSEANTISIFVAFTLLVATGRKLARSINGMCACSFDDVACTVQIPRKATAEIVTQRVNPAVGPCGPSM